MEKLRAYLKSSTDELVTKVTWPKWEELQGSTIIVMVAALLFAFIVYLIDVAGSGILGLFYQFFEN